LPQLKTDIDYKIYPNPFRESILISLNNNSDEAYITIYNTKGQLIFNKSFNHEINWNGTFTNGSKVNPGVYFISVSDKKTGKLLLNEKTICRR